MYPKKCAECGGSVDVSCAPVPIDVRGERFFVSDVEHAVCSSCGEVLLDMEAIQRVQRDAVRQSREGRGLLSPDEIRAIRQKLGLSQVAFEDALGVGPKTVVRWEKGTVFQSSTADRLMRLLDSHPELLPVLRSGELYPRGMLKGKTSLTKALLDDRRQEKIREDGVRRGRASRSR